MARRASACRLFGTQRPSIGATERTFSGLVIGDAALVGDHRWTARPSVALARASRSAAEQHLVFRRIPETIGNAPLTFQADGWVNDASLERYLEAAARATTHLGAGRSRGLARVDIAVRWDEPSRTDKAPAWPGASGDVRLRVSLTSPALMGASIADASYRETRQEIPGAAVRGAIGFALRGTIRGIPEHSRSRLAQALGSGLLSFGRGRSAGWGQARIDVELAPALRPIADRAAAFDRALRSHLRGAGLTTDRIGRLIPVTLLSPLWSSAGDPDADGERDLRAAVGAAGCFLAARRFARDGAWDQRTGETVPGDAVAGELRAWRSALADKCKEVADVSP